MQGRKIDPPSLRTEAPKHRSTEAPKHRAPRTSHKKIKGVRPGAWIEETAQRHNAAWGSYRGRPDLPRRGNDPARNRTYDLRPCGPQRNTTAHGTDRNLCRVYETPRGIEPGSVRTTDVPGRLEVSSLPSYSGASDQDSEVGEPLPPLSPLG